MNNFFIKIFLWLRKRKVVFTILAVFVFAVYPVLSAFAQEAAAENEKPPWLGNFLVGVIGYPASWIVNFLGFLINLIMAALIAVAQYNGFIESDAVVNGWVIIRDICNMFFVVILLVIAFSVILRIDGYDIKKMIPKLLIIAVLINFSKTICGLIIDAGQVVMMTFVMSFKNLMGGNLNEMLGIQGYLSFGNKDGMPADGAQILISYFAAIIFLIISLVVIVAILAVLVMRIIMLWIYVVLSPLAFFLASFPQGKGYSKKWWTDFTENVIIGPVLAFFLWLSFVSLGTAEENPLNVPINAPAGLVTSLTGPAIVKYVVSIGMLVGGLIIAKGMAGSVGGIAGKALGKIQDGAGFMKKHTVDRATGALKAGAVMAGGAAWAGVKTGAGTVDRLAGRGIGKGFDAAGKKMGDNKLGRAFVGAGAALGSGGLAATPLTALKNAPEKLLNKIRGGDAEKRQMEKDIARGTTNSDGSFDHGGARYKWHDKEKAYQQIDDKGAFKLGDGTKLQFNGENVKRMGAIKASYVEAREAAGSASRGASNAAQGKKINEEMDNIKNSGMGNEEAMRMLNNFSTSAPKKMALAMFLASNKAFKNKAEKDSARSVLAGNSVLAGKFDEDVVKNQAHLAYDLEAKRSDGTVDVDLQARENERFKKDVGKGKVDVTNLHKDAIDNKSFQDALHKALTVTIERSDGKGGVEKIQDDSRYAQVLKKNAENNNGANYSKVAEAAKKQINTKNIADDKMAPLFAELSGDFRTAFKKDGGELDLNALAKFFRNTNSKGLNRVGSKDLEEFIKLDPKAGEAIAKEMTATKIKSLDRDDDTRDLSDVLKKLMNEVASKGGGGKDASKIKREAEKVNKDFGYDDDYDEVSDGGGI